MRVAVVEPGASNGMRSQYGARMASYSGIAENLGRAAITSHADDELAPVGL